MKARGKPQGLSVFRSATPQTKSQEHAAFGTPWPRQFWYMEPGSRISLNSGLNSCVSFSHYGGRVRAPSFQAASFSSSMSIFSDCGDRSKKKSIGTLSTPAMANAAAAMKVCGVRLPFVHWGHEYHVWFDGRREQISNLASFCCSSMSVRNSLLPTAASMPATRKLIVRQQCLHLHRTRQKSRFWARL